MVIVAIISAAIGGAAVGLNGWLMVAGSDVSAVAANQPLSNTHRVARWTSSVEL